MSKKVVIPVFAKSEAEWTAYCTDRDGGIDALTNESATGGVHHIISRRWKSVALLIDNGLCVTTRTHRDLHRDEDWAINYLLKHILPFDRFERIIKTAQDERGFKDTIYYKVYQQWIAQK